jgi:hypothetical protein
MRSEAGYLAPDPLITPLVTSPITRRAPHVTRRHPLLPGSKAPSAVRSVIS